MNSRATRMIAALLPVLAISCGSDSSSKLDQYYKSAIAEVERGEGPAQPASEPAGEGSDVAAGFTIYPSAEVVSESPVETARGNGRAISMTTRASPGEVARFYERQAEQAGLSVDRSSSEQGTITLTGNEPGGASIDLTAAQMADGGTSANLMVIDAPQAER